MTSFTIIYIILTSSILREIQAANMWPPCMEGYVEIQGDGASSCVEIDDGNDNNLWRRFLTIYEPFYEEDDDGGDTNKTDEMMVRIELLNASAQFISEHNNNVLNENSSYTLGLTPYRYVKQSNYIQYLYGS
jgi:hypothetical protein